MKDLLISCLKLAGNVHRSHFGSVSVMTKSGDHDRVTAADIEAEKVTVSAIHEQHPDHNVLGEEGKYPTTDSPYLWIIDPLDGTNNFSKGLPIFSVSIALAKDGELLMGGVYDPSRDELFFAEKGKGATLNGNPLSVSNHPTVKGALLVTGFYYDRGQSMRNTLAEIDAFFSQEMLGIRRLGSAALDLCYVACGRFDGFWEFLLNAWDFAAGQLIVEEAGGKTSTNAGTDLTIGPCYVVASNGHIHSAMLSTLK